MIDAALSQADWRFVDAHRVARLSTIDAKGLPNLVPICFVADGIAIYSPLDEKPKRVKPMDLGRVKNILARPEVCFLVDDYAEDWQQLAYVMIHGRGSVVDVGSSEHQSAVAQLREKYPQYQQMAIECQPVIRIEPVSVRRWTASSGALAIADRPIGRYLDFEATVRGRRSVRSFRPDPIPRTLVERVLDAGRWAPSPHGRMPWRFAVVTSADVKQRLSDAMGEEWERQLAMDGEAHDVIARRKHRSHERILQAPVSVVICLYLEDLDRYPDPVRQQAETIMAIQSLGAAAQNMLLTAYHLGLDAGWMCAPLFCADTVRNALGLAPELHPHALLTMGYPARDPVRRERLAIETLIVSYD